MSLPALEHWFYTARRHSETARRSRSPLRFPVGTGRRRWRSTFAKGVGVKRFFFHLLKGPETIIDDAGMPLSGLDAVVSEAQRIAVRLIASEDAPAREWMRWKLDVKDEDGTRLFFFPFEEVSLHDVAEAKASRQLPGAARKSV
jgi:hypothetical protein